MTQQRANIYELVIESNDSNAHELTVPTPPPAMRDESAVRSTTSTRALHSTSVLGPTTRLKPSTNQHHNNNNNNALSTASSSANSLHSSVVVAPIRPALVRSDETGDISQFRQRQNGDDNDDDDTVTNSVSNNGHHSIHEDNGVSSSSIAKSMSSSMTGSGSAQFDAADDAVTAITNVVGDIDSNSTSSKSQHLTSDVPFVAGNPSIHLTRGVIHVFKRLSGSSSVTSSSSSAIDEALGDSTPDESLPSARIPLLLLPAVPHNVTHAILLNLLDEAAFDVRHIRVVRGDSDAPGDVYMALIRFNSQSVADRWRASVLGKHFIGKEGPRISVFYVARVSLVRRGARLFPHDGAVELPRCVICLERMDSSVTGVMTTQCAHTFHCLCLARWADVEQQQHQQGQSRSKVVDEDGAWQVVGGNKYAHDDEKSRAPVAAHGSGARGIASSCPVCRYAQRKESTSAQCSIEGCDVTDALWTCLVCATINCGRAANKHALAHFHESGHAFSLEIATGRIWSYVGDAYVHRLMHSGAEYMQSGDREERGTVPAAAATPTPGKSMFKTAKATSGSDDDDVFDKDDAMEAEYTYLLTSQLAAQRRYYEESLRVSERQVQKRLDELYDENERLKLSVARMEKKLDHNERSLANKESALTAADEVAARRISHVTAEKVQAERTAQQYRDTGRAASSALREAQAQLGTAQQRVKDLEEELHDMRFALTMGEKLANNEELQGAQISGVAPKESKMRRMPRRK